MIDSTNRPRTILVATGNRGKAREFREMLASHHLEWSDLTQHPNAVEVPETGETFAENAALKASGYARQFNTWALADDSGLEVDALNGAPGVYSARWAEMNQAGRGDADNNTLLLRQLTGVEDARRTARFVCALALSDPAGQIVLTTRDTVEGRILHSPRGSNGFGYDPLFLIDLLGKTTAELPPEQKHQISHRGKALAALGDDERAGVGLSGPLWVISLPVKRGNLGSTLLGGTGRLPAFGLAGTL